MNMKSQEYSQEIERLKNCLNSAEGVSITDYKKWVAMLDMLLQVKISIENFEINTQLDEQAETFKGKEVTESVKRFNLGSVVQEIVEGQTKDYIEAMKQRDLQIQNDNGLTEEQEFMSSIDESDATYNKEEMEGNDEQ